MVTLDPEPNRGVREYLLKEVEVIQDIIKRMASNSFMIKGWVITLVVATLLFKGTKSQAVIAFIPLLAFWFLDANFLRQEVMYRKLYKWVIDNRFKTDEYLFDMDAHRFQDKTPSVLRLMFSSTLVSFYGTIVLLIVVYFLLPLQ